MSSATQTPPTVITARNNKHVSSACRSCQSKHTKCDGNQLIACSQCSQREIECVWAVEQDGRLARGGECYKCPQLLTYISLLEAQLASITAQQNFQALQTSNAPAELLPNGPALYPHYPVSAQMPFTQPDAHAHYGQFSGDTQLATFPLLVEAQVTASTSGHHGTFPVDPTQAFPAMDYGLFDQGNTAYQLNNAASTYALAGPPLHPVGDGQYHARREDVRRS